MFNEEMDVNPPTSTLQEPIKQWPGKKPAGIQCKGCCKLVGSTDLLDGP